MLIRTLPTTPSNVFKLLSIVYNRSTTSKGLIFNPYNAEATSVKSVQGSKNFGKLFKPCHVSIHWMAPAKNFQMSTHEPRFHSFLKVFLHYFVLFKLATGSLRVKH